MPEIFDNNPNASAELNKYFPQSFSFIEVLNNLIEYVKSLPIEPNAEILNKIEALENEFLTVKKASEDATADVTELTGKYVSLLQQVTTLSVNVSGFNDNIESIEGEIQGIQENITNIKNKNTGQDNSIATINQEISGIKNKNTEQDNRITTINQEISGINQSITHNDEDISSLFNKLNFQNLISSYDGDIRKDFWSVNTENRYGGENKNYFFVKNENDNEWLNVPSNRVNTLWIGIRLVFFLDNKRVLVLIIEAYPTPCTLFASFFNSTYWMGWKCINPIEV